jgi:hypothetical protein
MRLAPALCIGLLAFVVGSWMYIVASALVGSP